MSRSILSTLAFAIALAAGANAANAAGYDSGWRDQAGYRVTQTVSYEESSYDTPRVIHRAHGYRPWGYTVRSRPVVEPCH